MLSDGRVLITGGQETSPLEGPVRLFAGISNAELYSPAKLIPAPVLFSLSGDGHGQAAIWHASTGDIASAAEPASAGEALSMYTNSLADNGAIAPQVRLAAGSARRRFAGIGGTNAFDLSRTGEQRRDDSVAVIRLLEDITSRRRQKTQ